MKITLLCAAGMSTNLLVKKMKDYISKEALEVQVIAMGIDSFSEYKGQSDVVMLGPQVSYRIEEVKAMNATSIPVAVINMSDYGMLNGEKVVKNAIALIK